MTELTLWWLPLAALAGTLLLTRAIRRYALSRAIIDVPNGRSSHSVPTPRGGGLAICSVVLVGAFLLGIAGAIPWHLVIGFCGGGAAVAWIGWRDDRNHVRASVRAAVHLAAAAWVVAWMRGFPALTLGTSQVDLGIFGSLVAIVAIAWFINLFNFMDGIDGIAGVEAVTAAGTIGLLLLRAGRPSLAILGLTVAGAAMGFLWWNWPPAAIFMGDVGSGFLGYTLAVLALESERAHAVPALLTALPLAVFIVDASLTLLRRIARRERWYDAHRSHAYQRAVQHGLPHRTVTLTVLGVNIVLALIALAAAVHPQVQGRLMMVALAIVGALYFTVEQFRPM